MNTDTPCTAEQRDAIVRAARQRADYLQWIADKLLRTDDLLIRKEAAAALVQLTEVK